ncbi:hypothetical protein A1Q1_03378 [Trichosporon asahii var. asahii CBS 2479]|uniref:Uncharacterized protein n=1 Tax=Trichosporon asahii var. asahii (strain ATCC 90039 / CBS 2479 / JCM 2466 / KCTC 7840 / NBRC 103889/ NCYC 2677 / UAMH 7654) TaxID=1186058 RepID=J5TSQ1_TRIAS|nr:hypothetical protein A1Q1_03378 [Trichosporon asahii var. asahii CBS 2479]EJT52576.1 hypothetical protein A1Q1_03378 [Trichosporon asahii var. asahii CBS 2479]
MSFDFIFFQLIPMALPTILASPLSDVSLELGLLNGAVGLVGFVYANFFGLNSSTTRFEINITRALYHCSLSCIGICLMSVPTWQFLESAETLYHIILYFASALVVIPTLSAYNGHGFNMTFDYIRRGLFWMCMAHFIITRMFTTLVAYVVWRSEGLLEDPARRNLFYNNTCKAYLPVLYAFPAYAVFGYIPPMNAAQHANKIASWFCAN